MNNEQSSSGGEPKAYQWSFDGSYMPGKSRFHSDTFSVGCFQWLPKASGKGLKRGKAAKRFRGSVSKPEEVYAKARAFCDTMNAAQEKHP